MATPATLLTLHFLLSSEWLPITWFHLHYRLCTEPLRVEFVLHTVGLSLVQLLYELSTLVSLFTVCLCVSCVHAEARGHCQQSVLSLHPGGPVDGAAVMQAPLCTSIQLRLLHIHASFLPHFAINISLCHLSKKINFHKKGSQHVLPNFKVWYTLYFWKHYFKNCKSGKHTKVRHWILTIIMSYLTHVCVTSLTASSFHKEISSDMFIQLNITFHILNLILNKIYVWGLFQNIKRQKTGYRINTFASLPSQQAKSGLKFRACVTILTTVLTTLTTH